MNREPLEMKTGLLIVLASAGWLLVLLLFFLYGLKFHSENSFDNRLQKSEILSRMRINMLKSHEKEKSAVMAVTDEESQLFADQSLAATDAVENDLHELSDLIEAGKNRKEMQLLLEFSGCWRDFRNTDELLLGFAVQNTNLKAAALSYTKGANAIRRFEDTLAELVKISDKDGGIANNRKIAVNAFRAVRAALDIYTLQPPHINSADDKKMDEIELIMRGYCGQVKDSLQSLADIADQQPQYVIPLKKATSEFMEFMEVNAEVVRLSRLNSNIRSVELSLGKKRKVALRCEESLNLLQETVQKRVLKSIK